MTGESTGVKGPEGLLLINPPGQSAIPGDHACEYGFGAGRAGL